MEMSQLFVKPVVEPGSVTVFFFYFLAETKLCGVGLKVLTSDSPCRGHCHTIAEAQIQRPVLTLSAETLGALSHLTHVTKCDCF